MTSYQYPLGITKSITPVKVFAGFLALPIFWFGFSLPAHAQGFKSILDTYGNAVIARRLNRDLNTVTKPFVARHSFSPVNKTARFHKQSIDNQYQITDIGSLGGTESFAYSINDYSVIVGLSRTQGDAERHPFVYSKKKMTDLYPAIETAESINDIGQIVGGITNGNIFVPAKHNFNTGQTELLGTLGGILNFGFNGTALANNDADQTVGYSYIDNINRHAFLNTDGVIYDIGSFGGSSSASAINKHGAIVGFSSNSITGRPHAFLFAKGVMHDINPANDPKFENSESYARDINDRGEIVGEFLAPNQSAFRSFIYKNGKFTEFGLEGSPMTISFSINKRRNIVGIMDVPYQATCPTPTGTIIVCTKFKQHAFLRLKGNLVDLNDFIPASSDWELSWAFAINNKDEIVGYGTRNGKFRAFLLTPRSNKAKN